MAYRGFTRPKRFQKTIHSTFCSGISYIFQWDERMSGIPPIFENCLPCSKCCGLYPAVARTRGGIGFAFAVGFVVVFGFEPTAKSQGAAVEGMRIQNSI